MKSSSYNHFFANFANKTRLGIILSLQNEPLSVNEIAKKLDEEQSNVSHHLKNLANCSILNVKQNGKKRIYSINKTTVFPMLRLVQAHVDQNCQPKCGECQKCP